jgi:hypothetical protein
LNNSSNKVLIY